MSTKYTSSPEINDLIDTVVEQGWRVEKGRKHVKVYPPDKSRPIVTIPSTPSDRRAVANVRSQLRRSGAVL